MALSLSLITAAASLLLEGTANPLSDWGGMVSRPFVRLFSRANDKLRQTANYVHGVEALAAENDSLRRELAEARQEARRGKLLEGENARLRSLLELGERTQSLTLQPAWVTGRSSDNWQAAVTLDQGSDQGVAAGDCAIDETGALVGRVGETGSSWCTLRLVTDGGSGLAAQGLSGESVGVLEGDLTHMARGEVRLTGLAQDNLPSPGEEVVTFSTQGKYPSGLAVGTVTALTTDPGGMTKSALLRPQANLEKLTEVFVITDFQEAR